MDDVEWLLDNGWEKDGKASTRATQFYMHPTLSPEAWLSHIDTGWYATRCTADKMHKFDSAIAAATFLLVGA